MSLLWFIPLGGKPKPASLRRGDGGLVFAAHEMSPRGLAPIDGGDVLGSFRETEDEWVRVDSLVVSLLDHSGFSVHIP